MTVPIIASAWNYFHRINKQDFSGIIIQAISMASLIKDFNEDDSKKLEWLRDKTHKDIKRSMFELDRYVDETHGTISNKNVSFPDGQTFNQDQIQNFLCLAVSEIYNIIYKNFKDFKIEEKMNLDEDEIIEGDW